MFIMIADPDKIDGLIFLLFIQIFIIYLFSGTSYGDEHGGIFRTSN